MPARRARGGRAGAGAGERAGGRLTRCEADRRRSVADRAPLRRRRRPVSDDEISAVQRALWDDLRLVVEPGGAAALAAIRSGAYRPDPGERVVVVVCGSNCDPATVTGPAAP